MTLANLNETVDGSNFISLLRQDLKSKGIVNISTVAEHMTALQDIQIRDGIYSYDRYLNNSSNSNADISSFLSGDTRDDCIVWCVNHYLGLNRHPEVIKATRNALDKFGTGSGTSAMSGGLSSLHIDLINKLQNMFNKECAMLFPTGYSANLGAISSIVTKDDLIIIDRDCHASIIDGCKLSGAKLVPFKNNDVGDLERKIDRFSKNYPNTIVIVESAYSMTGNLAPLKDYVELKKKHDFLLYVDEAHTFGIYGDQGRGYCQQLGILDSVDFIMGTLSKSTASIGGFVVSDKKYRPVMKFYSNAYLFQATIPPANAATILAAIEVFENNPELIDSLHHLNSYFRNKLTVLGFDLGQSESPVIPIYIENPSILFEMGKRLYEEGIFSVTVTYPAVKPKEGRIRFIVSTNHTTDQIDRTVDTLEKLGRELKIIS